MKLASIKNGSRDGQLVLVSRDLTQAITVTDIALTMQQLLDEWHDKCEELSKRYISLNNNELPDAFDFKENDCLAPLPRAFQWIDGSAYVNHVELVRQARGAQMPDSFWSDPLVYQGGSDSFIAPHDDILLASEDWGIDFEAEIAVITDDVPMGVSSDIAKQAIKLIMLVNDVSLRNLIPAELNKGFGFFQSKPSTSFSPVAITPDELGDAWQDTKVCLPLTSSLNGELYGQPDAGKDMTFNFAELIVHAAKSRPLGAGTIIGSGTVSNYDRSSGSSCLVEKRMLETIAEGQAKTSFMQFGDRVKIEMFNRDGKSIFGAIDQKITKY